MGRARRGASTVRGHAFNRIPIVVADKFQIPPPPLGVRGAFRKTRHPVGKPALQRLEVFHRPHGNQPDRIFQKRSFYGGVNFQFWAPIPINSNHRSAQSISSCVQTPRRRAFRRFRSSSESACREISLS